MFLSDLEKGTSIFIDANIFIYHFSKESRFNQACTSFLKKSGTLPIFLTYGVLGGNLREGGRNLKDQMGSEF